MMNDKWIQASHFARVAYVEHRARIVTDGADERDNELWLDCVGLIETSWLLFAGRDGYTYENFGYPGTYWGNRKQQRSQWKKK